MPFPARGSRLIVFGGIAVLVAGLAGLGIAMARQGLSRADSWSSVISGFVGLVGLAVTLTGGRRPERRKVSVTRRTAWGRQRLPLNVHRLLEAQARAAESLPYQVPGVGGARLSSVHVRQQVESASGPEEERALLAGGQRNEERRQERRSRLRSTAQPIERVLGRHRHLVIEGGPGLGKSTLARDLTARLARAWLAGGPAPTPEPVAPLLVTAQALSQHRHRPWAEALTAAAAEFGQHADGASAVDPDGMSWLIIVDGLDEVPEPQRRDLVEVLAERMAQPGSQARLIILTRPLPEGSRQRLRVASSGAYTILPFTRAALLEFVGKAVVARGDAEPVQLAARFLDELRRVELDDVATTPLLATIALAVYLEDPQRRLPRGRRELYEQYLGYLNDSSTTRRPRLREQLRRRLGGVPGGTEAAARLYDRRRDLVEHLALRRVASDAPLDGAALDWCRAAGIAPAEPVASWPEAVRDALTATGLMVRHGSGLRFIHHSFAEHIAAAHDARSLPDTFDAGCAVWPSLVRRAVDDEGFDATVLAHWAGTRPAGALLTWLQSGSGIFQALALTLIGEGATAEPAQVRAGLRYVESEAWRSGDHDALVRLLRGLPRDAETRGWALATVGNADDYPALQAAAALLLIDEVGADRDAAVTVLRGRLDDGLPSDALVAVARALVTLAPGCTAEVGGVLRDALRRPGTRLAATAHALADLGPAHRSAAVAELATLLRGSERIASERIDAATSLAELDDQAWAESVAALRTVLGDESTEINDRLSSAQAILEIDRDGHRDVVGWLRSLVTDPGSDNIWRAMDAARMLADCGTDERQFATAALREIAGGQHRPPWHRLQAASTMMEIGADNDSAAGVLLGVLADPAADAWDFREAAGALHKLGGAHRSAAIAQVRGALAEPGYPGSPIAVALARLCPDEVGEVSAALRRAAADPLLSGPDLRDVAQTLAGLGPDHRREACAALLEAARMRLDDALVAVQSLVTLYPESIDDAAAVCDAIAADPARQTYARTSAINLLSGLGPAHLQRSGELFDALLAETDADPMAAWSVVQMMYEPAPRLRATAVTHIDGLLSMDGLSVGERVRLAIKLCQLSPDHRSEVAATLVEAVVDPYTDSSDRLDAAEWLIHSTDNREAVVVGLRTVLLDPSAVSWYLGRAAAALSRLGDRQGAGAATLITDELAQPGRDARRAGLAIALGTLPGHRARAADVLRGLVADPYADSLARVDAAEWLIQSGSDRHPAVAGLLDVLNDRSAADWHLARAVDALTRSGGPARTTVREALDARLANDPTDTWIELGPLLATLDFVGRATVTTKFRTLLDDQYLSVGQRMEVARWLAKMPSQRVAVVARLRGLIAEGSLSGADRVVVAAFLAEVSPLDHPVAAAAVRAVLADTWTAAGDRIDAADWLSRLPAQRDEAAAAVHEMLTDQAIAPIDAANAGKLLCRMDPRRRDTVAAELQARIDNPHVSAEDRCDLAMALGQITIGRRQVAADVLVTLLSDPATPGPQLIEIAEWLARVPAHRAAAGKALDRLLSDPDLELEVRQSAALAYAELCRPPRAELERHAGPSATPRDRLVIARAIAADPARARDALTILDGVAADPTVTLDERWHAAALLGDVSSGVARSAGLLRDLLTAGRLSVDDRCLVAHRLAALGGEHRQAAAGALRAMLALPVPPAETVTLCTALGEISRTDRELVLEHLVAAVSAAHAPRERRRRAAVALAGLSGHRPDVRELPVLLEASKRDVGVAEALAVLSPDEGATALARMLDEPSTPTALRGAAATALAGIRSARRDAALAELRRLCSDPTTPAYVRVGAGRALGSAGGEHACAAALVLAAVCVDLLADPADRLSAAVSLTALPTATADAVAVIAELAVDPGTRPVVRRLAARALAEVAPGRLVTAANTLRELHHDAEVALAVRLLAAADLSNLGPAHQREGATLLRAAADGGEPRARLLAGALLAASRSADRQFGLDAVDRLTSAAEVAPRIVASAGRVGRWLNRLTT